MSNDSASHNEVTPAPRGAGARHGRAVSIENDHETAVVPAVLPPSGAGARHVARLHLYREDGVEYIIQDNERLVRDLDLGRLMGFSRPRDIRKLLARMAEQESLSDAEFVVIDDDYGGKVHYLSQMAAVKLAMRSEASNKEDVLVQMLAAFGRGDRPSAESMPLDKALAAFERTLGRISREKDPTIRAAYIPVLQRYGRMAGVPVPQADVLLASARLAGSSDHPRLPGV